VREHTFIFIAEVQLILSEDRQNIVVLKAVRGVFYGVSRPARNLLMVRLFPICHLLHCKRWPFSVQKVAFWNAKYGISQNN